jgi:transposase-like protein
MEFGDWVVIENGFYKKPSFHRFLKCRCACGLERMVSAQALLDGDSRACWQCGQQKKQYNPPTCTVGTEKTWGSLGVMIKVDRDKLKELGRTGYGIDRNGNAWVKKHHLDAFKAEGRSLRSDEKIINGMVSRFGFFKGSPRAFTCEWCGKDFVKPRKPDMDHPACSKSCRGLLKAYTSKSNMEELHRQVVRLALNGASGRLIGKCLGISSATACRVIRNAKNH